jgi:hypothetical protein
VCGVCGVCDAELDGVQELYNYPGLILSPRSAVMRDHLDIFSPEHIHHSLFPKNAPSKYSGMRRVSCLSCRVVSVVMSRVVSCRVVSCRVVF